MAMVKRLKDNHALAIKVRKLEELMNELGLSVEYTCNDYTFTDTETGVIAFYRDVEGDSLDSGA